VRAIAIALVLVACLASSAPAQQSAAPPASPVTAMKTFCSSADVQALIAKAKSERKDGQPIVVERVVQLAPYNANLEYRASVGPAAVHEKEAELMYVVDGSGTIVTGGTLVNPTHTNGSNLTGTAIDGGTQQKKRQRRFHFHSRKYPALDQRHRRNDRAGIVARPPAGSRLLTTESGSAANGTESSKSSFLSRSRCSPRTRRRDLTSGRYGLE